MISRNSIKRTLFAISPTTMGVAYEIRDADFIHYVPPRPSPQGLSDVNFSDEIMDFLKSTNGYRVGQWEFVLYLYGNWEGASAHGHLMKIWFLDPNDLIAFKLTFGHTK